MGGKASAARSEDTQSASASVLGGIVYSSTSSKIFFECTQHSDHTRGSYHKNASRRTLLGSPSPLQTKVDILSMEHCAGSP